MRVAMLSNGLWPDQFGGLERYVHELGSALATEGIGVDLIAKSRQPPPHYSQPELRALPFGPPPKESKLFAAAYPISVARKSMAKLNQSNPDIIHGHFSVPMTIPVIRRLPYIYTVHGLVHAELLDERNGSYLLPPGIARLARSTLRLQEKAVISRAHRVIVLSEHMRSEVSSLVPQAAERTIVIGPGVSSEFFEPPSPSTIRSNTGRFPLLVAARRLSANRGLSELVRAMPKVVESYASAQLVIAGDGLLRDGLEKLVLELGMRNHVAFVGRLTTPEMRDLYASADLSVIPSQSVEGFGLSTVEAMACGVPSVVTPVGANVEVIAGLGQEFIAADSTPSALADAIVRVCDGNTLPNIKAVCHQLASRYRWESVAQQHLEVYRSLLSDDNPRSSI